VRIHTPEVTRRSMSPRIPGHFYVKRPGEVVLYFATCAGAAKLSLFRVRSYNMLVLAEYKNQPVACSSTLRRYAGVSRVLEHPQEGFVSLVQLPPPRPGTLTYPLRLGYDEIYSHNLPFFCLLSSWLIPMRSGSAIEDQETRALVHQL
jgi:hypothetical protein